MAGDFGTWDLVLDVEGCWCFVLSELIILRDMGRRDEGVLSSTDDPLGLRVDGLRAGARSAKVSSVIIDYLVEGDRVLSAFKG